MVDINKITQKYSESKSDSSYMDIFKSSHVQISNSNMGYFDKIKGKSIIGKAALEKLKISEEEEIELLKQASRARSKVSETFWGINTIKAVEYMNADLRSNLMKIEKEMCSVQNNYCTSVFSEASAKINEIMGSNFNDFIKEKAVNEVIENMELTIKRIKNK